MEVSEKISWGRRDRLGVAVNVALLSLLAGALFAGVNVLVATLSYRTDIRADLTADRWYTLDPATSEFMRSLDDSIEVLFVHGTSDAFLAARVPDSGLRAEAYGPVLAHIADVVRLVLAECRAATPRIRFRILDNDTAPLAAARAAEDVGLSGTTILNQLVVVSEAGREMVALQNLVSASWGGIDTAGQLIRPTVLETHVEEAVLGAATAVTAGERRRVLFTAGHGEFAIGAELSGLRLLLEGHNTDVGTLESPLVAVPADTDVIVVARPARPFAPEEKAALAAFENRGGRLLLFLGPRSRELFEELLEPHGLELRRSLVRDRTQPVPEHLSAPRLLRRESPILRPLADRGVAVAFGECRPVRVAPDHAPGVRRHTLAETGAEARGAPIAFDAEGRRLELRDRPEENGPFVLGATSARPAAGEGGGEARIVLFGSDDILSPPLLSAGSPVGNRDALLNAFFWLTGRESRVTVRPRSFTGRRVELTAGRITAFRVVAIGVLPLLLLGTAVTVRLLRRRAP